MRSSLIAILGAALCIGPASAHAFLKTSAPAVGSTVQQPPTKVEIEFTESIEPLFSTITVTDAAGTRIDTGAAHLDGDDTHLAIAVKRLSPGTCNVVWHALSTDTHRTEGKFTFTLKP